MYQSVEEAEFDFATLQFVGEFIFVQSMIIVNHPTVNGDLIFFNLN